MSHKHNRILNRRTFAAIVAGTGAAAAQQPQAPAQQPAGAPDPNTSLNPPRRQGTLDDTPPFKDIQFTRKDAALQVQPFPMNQVRLLPSPLLDAAEWNRGYMNRLSTDRLVHNFKLNAGLESKAPPLGGWEEYMPFDPAKPRHIQTVWGVGYVFVPDAPVETRE